MTGSDGKLAPLATTSTGNDDVALEVENAANGNLIHASLRFGKSSKQPFHIVRVITRQRKGSARSAPVHAPLSALPDENHSAPVARSKPCRRFLSVQVLHLEHCFRPDHVERAHAPLTHPVEIDHHTA